MKYVSKEWWDNNWPGSDVNDRGFYELCSGSNVFGVFFYSPLLAARSIFSWERLAASLEDQLDEISK
jgi:hypothetical protein